MARITVEDCLEKVNNRFALIHMAAKRVRQLRKGVEPLVASKNRDVVISLREIAGGYIKQKEPPAQVELLEKEVDVPTKEPGEGGEVAAKVEKEVDVPTEEPGEGGEVAAEVEKETTVEKPEGE